MEAFPLPNREASTVANKLVDKVFLRYSIPEQLHTDQGQQFKAQLLQEVCKLLNVHKTKTTPCNPPSDGLHSTILLTRSTTYARYAWPTIAVCSHLQAFTSCLGIKLNFQWISFTDQHAQIYRHPPVICITLADPPAHSF